LLIITIDKGLWLSMKTLCKHRIDLSLLFNIIIVKRVAQNLGDIIGGLKEFKNSWPRWPCVHHHSHLPSRRVFQRVCDIFDWYRIAVGKDERFLQRFWRVYNIRCRSGKCERISVIKVSVPRLGNLFFENCFPICILTQRYCHGSSVTRQTQSPCFVTDRWPLIIYFKLFDLRNSWYNFWSSNKCLIIKF
jgi:hypothetical protein